MQSFPTENLPQYEKTEKQILEQIDNELKSRLVDEGGSGLSVKDLLGGIGASDSFNR